MWGLIRGDQCLSVAPTSQALYGSETDATTRGFRYSRRSLTRRDILALLKKTSKADLAADEAQQAWDAGGQFYILEAGSSFRSATKGVAEALETVETIGWKLAHVSHVWSTDMANHAVGYYLFRR